MSKNISDLDTRRISTSSQTNYPDIEKVKYSRPYKKYNECNQLDESLIPAFKLPIVKPYIENFSPIA